MRQTLVCTISLLLLSSFAAAQAQDQEGSGTEQSPATSTPATPSETPPSPAAPPPTPAAPPPAGAAVTPATPPKATSPSPKGKAEVISVTGSRIRRIDVEGSQPITTYSKEEIDRSGYGNVSDFVRNKLPSATLSTENQTVSQNAGSASFGGRDMEAEYTLVLINGRRLPTNAIAEDFVDLNLIPLAAVERIEYLTDGASAIYGSDAVAGVLNIITKRQFEGTTVTARLGQASRGDGTETSLQLVSGASGDRSSILIAGDLWKREPILAKDRPLIKSTIAPNGKDGRSPNGLPGYIIRADGSVEPFADCPAGNVSGSSQCLYDFAPLYEAVPKMERQSIYTIWDHNLLADVTLFGEARFSRTYTLYANGAAPGGVSVSGTAPSNPYPGEDIFVVRRYLDFGPRVSDNTNQSLNLVLGLRGPINDSVNWELAATSHRLQNEQIGKSGNIHSETASTYFNNGVLNPFIYNTATTPEQIAAFEAIQAHTFRAGDLTLQTYNLTFDGNLPFDLPGGPIGFAIGAEYRQEEFVDRSDIATSNDEILGGAGGNGKGEQDNRAYYLEAAFPILKSLDLKTAVRNDNIDNRDDETTYNAGIAYRPLSGWLLRASYATGFKAPGLHYRFLGQSFGVARARDPYSCETFGECEEFEINSRTGGNPDLTPETSVYVNFGTVVQPTAELALSADFWSLKIDDKVGQLEVQEILNNPDLYGQYINRVNGRLNVDGANVSTIYQNLTKEESSGVEVSGNYTVPVGAAQIASSIKLNKILSSKAQTSATQPLCEVADNYKGVDGTLSSAYRMPVWSVGMDIRYYGPVDTYSGGFEPASCRYADPSSRYTVKPNAEVAFNASYTAPFGTTFGVGIQNAFDQEPSFDPNTDGLWPWYDQERYSNIGRFYYASVGHNFE